jgi:hypothetical protein
MGRSDPAAVKLEAVSAFSALRTILRQRHYRYIFAIVRVQAVGPRETFAGGSITHWYFEWAGRREDLGGAREGL